MEGSVNQRPSADPELRQLVVNLQLRTVRRLQPHPLRAGHQRTLASHIDVQFATTDVQEL